MDEFTIPQTKVEVDTWLKSEWPEWVDYEGLVYPISGFPPSCPWQFDANLTIDQIISEQFRPLEAVLPKTIQTLKTRCQSIFALQHQNRWYLLYILKIVLKNDNLSLKRFGGGEPTRTPQMRTEVSQLGWTVPNELKLLYQVHNGFGTFDLPEFIWDVVLPDRQLNVLSERFDEPDLVEYIPEDLLEFFPDGAGNGQYFYRKEGDILYTVDWDHETDEISKPEPFWEFVNRKLSKVDETKY